MKTWQRSVNFPFFLLTLHFRKSFCDSPPFLFYFLVCFVMRLTEREQAFLACSCWISGSLAGCLCLFGLMASAFLAARLFPTSQSCAEPGSQGCFGDMTRKGERAFLPSASRAWELDGCQSQGCRGMWPMSQDNDGIPTVLLILERFFLPLLTSSSSA